MKCLVVGCGSIGERHIRNLQKLSVDEILVCDTNSERLAFISEKYQVSAYTGLDEALKEKVDAVIICVSPNLHITVALQCIKHGAHLLIEKPISHNPDGIDEVLKIANSKILQVSVGYNLRFHPGLKLLKSLVDEGKVGRILSARLELGLYLPDWRPDYKQMYIARVETGGGVLLDHSHELDYIRWLMGEVCEVSCFTGRLRSLDLETEDLAEILLRFENGGIANLHFDIIQREYSRSCKLIGEKGTLTWKYPESKVDHFSAVKKSWQHIGPENAVDNEIIDDKVYLEEMDHFLKSLHGEPSPLVSGSEAKRVLEIALAASESDQTGKTISL